MVPRKRGGRGRQDAAPFSSVPRTRAAFVEVPDPVRMAALRAAYEGPTYLEVGWFWRFGKRWVVEWTPWGIEVSEVGRTGVVVSSCRMPADGVSYLDAFLGGATMASKWIAKAVVKKVKRTVVSSREHADLFDKRPALRDFMMELEGAEGVAREPSVLMVVVNEDGMRVGLKDEDCGGWLWRTGETLQETLDSLEKALQSGSAKWSGGASRRAKK